MNAPEYKLADIRFYEERFVICDFYCEWNQRLLRTSTVSTLMPVDTGESEQEWLATLFKLPQHELHHWVITDEGNFVEWPSSQIRLTAKQIWQPSMHSITYRWKEKRIKQNITAEELLGFWTSSMPCRHIGLHEQSICHQWDRALGKYSKSVVLGEFTWSFDGDSSFTIVHQHPESLVEAGLGSQTVMNCTTYRQDGRCMEVVYRIDTEAMQIGPNFGWWVKSKPPKWYRDWFQLGSKSK